LDPKHRPKSVTFWDIAALPVTSRIFPPARLLHAGGRFALRAFTPFITDKERRQAGCQHRLFFAQVEYCDNLIFHRRAAVEELTQRLLDLNRNIGQPKKITTIFGRKVTKEYKGKLQSVIEDLDCPTR